jgi:hypothetical protein
VIRPGPRCFAFRRSWRDALAATSLYRATLFVGLRGRLNDGYSVCVHPFMGRRQTEAVVRIGYSELCEMVAAIPGVPIAAKDALAAAIVLCEPDHPMAVEAQRARAAWDRYRSWRAAEEPVAAPVKFLERFAFYGLRDDGFSLSLALKAGRLLSREEKAGRSLSVPNGAGSGCPVPRRTAKDFVAIARSIFTRIQADSDRPWPTLRRLTYLAFGSVPETLENLRKYPRRASITQAQAGEIASLLLAGPPEFLRRPAWLLRCSLTAGSPRPPNTRSPRTATTARRTRSPAR